MEAKVLGLKRSSIRAVASKVEPVADWPSRSDSHNMSLFCLINKNVVTRVQFAEQTERALNTSSHTSSVVQHVSAHHAIIRGS